MNEEMEGLEKLVLHPWHNTFRPTDHDLNYENMSLSLVLPEPYPVRDFYLEEDELHPSTTKSPILKDEGSKRPAPAVEETSNESSSSPPPAVDQTNIKLQDDGRTVSFTTHIQTQLKEYFSSYSEGKDTKSTIPFAPPMQTQNSSSSGSPVHHKRSTRKYRQRSSTKAEKARKEKYLYSSESRRGKYSQRREISTKAEKGRKEKYLHSSESHRSKSYSYRKIPIKDRLGTKILTSDDLEVKDRQHGRRCRFHRHKSSRERRHIRNTEDFKSEIRSHISSDRYERRHASNIERLSEFKMASGAHSRSKMSESERIISEPVAESSVEGFISTMRHRVEAVTHRPARVSLPKQTLESKNNSKECISISELKRGEKSSKRKNSFDLIEPLKEPEEVVYEGPEPKEAVASKQCDKVSVKTEPFEEENEEEEEEVEEDDEDYYRFLLKYKKEQKARKNFSSDNDSDRSTSRWDVKKEIKRDGRARNKRKNSDDTDGSTSRWDVKKEIKRDGRARNKRKNSDDTDGSTSRWVVKKEIKRDGRAGNKRNNSDDTDGSTSRWDVNKEIKRDGRERNKRKNSHSSDRSTAKWVVKKEIKPDPDFKEDESHGFDCYYCKVCQLTLSSECTYKSHMLGKRHKKALSTYRIPEIAKAGLMSVMQTQEAYKTKDHAPRAGQVVLHVPSKIQHAAERISSRPVPGLDDVVEIRGGFEIDYYCELCKCHCNPGSILHHLVGFKHYVNCIKKIDRDFYEINKGRQKSQIGSKVKDLLLRDERRNGRGKIMVVKEVFDLKSRSSFYDEPGPSWRTPSLPPLSYGMKGTVKSEGDKWIDQPSENYLDRSKNDYYCTLCDAHMNNANMWEAHIIGQRHAKNKKKTPAVRENISKNRTVKAPPHVTSCLEKMLEDMHEEIIVGLDFIRETKAENGEMYNCYLCGAGCTSDIIDHLLSLKHRIKYLENVNATGQFPNGIVNIRDLEITTSYRETLIEGECGKIENEYGRGKVEIYISKH